ncbi:MAG: hypothetical protein KJN77_05190 [Gammaproteobacteria bacterium]|nr:hypothetical protein [Gammaproteobacteria bacterium]
MKNPKSQQATRAGKAKRRTISQRVGDSARLVGEIGDDLVNRPGVLPGKAHGWFRTWSGKVWKVRGGGLYAVGYALTFLFLEVRAIFSEISEARGVVDFFTNQIVEFVFRFLSESLVNMISAFLWPVYLIELWPPYGLILLAALFILFPLVLKKPIERWLFGSEALDDLGYKDEN